MLGVHDFDDIWWFLIKLFFEGLFEVLKLSIASVKDSIVDFVEQLKDLLNNEKTTYAVSYDIKDKVQDLLLKTLIPVLESSLDLIMSAIEKILDTAIAVINKITGSDSIREALQKYLDDFLDGYYTKVIKMLKQLLDLIDPSAPGPDVENIKKIVIDLVRESLEVAIKKMKERIA